MCNCKHAQHDKLQHAHCVLRRMGQALRGLRAHPWQLVGVLISCLCAECITCKHTHTSAHSANWTSRALNLAGIVSTTHQFPKAIWVDIFNKMCLESNPERAQVVYFHRYKKGSSDPLGRTRVCPGLVSPLFCLRDCVFQSLVKYANVEVYLEQDQDGKFVAKWEKGQGLRPSWCTKWLIMYFHGLVLFAILAWYLLYGWPMIGDCGQGAVW